VRKIGLRANGKYLSTEQENKYLLKAKNRFVFATN